jgi:tRNA threonylcarbamoyladenosine biosynthesis protein TsaB
MPDSDLLLCLDTSTPTARIGIVDGTGALRFATEATAERHSSHTLALCAEALKAVGIAPSGLAAIACGGGPGSFTGLRVGLAIAKGLALANGTPIVLVPSLEALSLDIAGAAPEIAGVPCIDAGKGEVYAGLGLDPFRQPLRVTPEVLAVRLAQEGPCVLAGNGADRHAELFDRILPPQARRAAVAGPSAHSVGKLAIADHQRRKYADLDSAVPFYGRPPDITVKGVKSGVA